MEFTILSYIGCIQIKLLLLLPIIQVNVNQHYNLQYQLVYIKIIEEMIDKNLQKLKYQTSAHHRQVLRGQIDQNLIDQIQISSTPSQNYQNAYKSLYYDQLQKSVHLHDQKKNLEQTKKEYDIIVAGKHQKVYSINQHQDFKNSVSAIQIPNLNYKDVGYINYDLLKQTKALDHTLKNYDGGQAFYRNHDQHLMNQKQQIQNMRLTLMKQMNHKQRSKQNQEMRKMNQQQAVKQKAQIQRYLQVRINQSYLDQKTKHRQQILDQIQEQRIKRGRRSIFNYNNFSRHNPITNPIEYHIDNPYILKQIQNQHRITQ